MTDSHDELESTVAAYALDAVEPEEAEDARAHIEGCAACRALYERLLRTVDLLPVSTPAMKPPDRLRARILNVAEASPRRVGEAAPRRKVLRLPVRRRFVWDFPASAGAVAAMFVVVLGLGAWNVSLVAQQTPGHYTLTGQGPMAGARASVTNYGRDSLALLDFRGMPELPAGQVYELWLIGADGKPLPGAVFTPDGNGTKQIVLNRSVSGYRRLAVTVEPGPDGVSTPSSQPQFTGQVA